LPHNYLSSKSSSKQSREKLSLCMLTANSQPCTLSNNFSVRPTSLPPINASYTMASNSKTLPPYSTITSPPTPSFICQPVSLVASNHTRPTPLIAPANPTSPPKQELPNIEKQSRTDKPTMTQDYIRNTLKWPHPLPTSVKTASKNNEVQIVIESPHSVNTSQWPQK
jgi:hypothetical protein